MSFSSCNALIIEFVKSGNYRQALSVYQNISEKESSQVILDKTFVALLKACSVLKDLERGQKIHAHIDNTGVGLLENNVFIGCAMVDMYAKCGFLAKSHEIFKKIRLRDVALWNALITGYVDGGRGEEAMWFLEEMECDGVRANSVTFVCILKACGSIRSIEKGQWTHAEIVKKGLDMDPLICNSLVDLYAKFGFLSTAKELFSKLPNRDIVAWNTIIGGYVECGHIEDAFYFFDQMQREGISMNGITSVGLLKACSSVGSLAKGKEIHVEVAKKGLETEALVGGSLVDMYAKCGALNEAQEMFERNSVRDIVSWTSLMAGYAEHGHNKEALDCFEKMRKHCCLLPDAFSFSCGLKACGSLRDRQKGREIHAEIVKTGFEKEVLVGNTLVNMYVNCGLLSTAHHLFNTLVVRDVVSLNSLMVGYTERGRSEEAIFCFEEMVPKGGCTNPVTIVCALKACCGSTGTIAKGREVHAQAIKAGIESELIIGNTLIDMYVKSCSLREAEQVFDKLVARDVVSWTALIAGYAQLGENENVFHTYDQMHESGIKPNLITFVHLLNACNHVGMVFEGETYFESMSSDYGLTPTMDHYTCMIDLLGRAGHLGKAVSMIRRMPMQPDLVVLHTVLLACRKWGNVEFGRHVFEHALRLDKKAEATYMYMFNIYSDASMHDDADKIEAMRVENIRNGFH